jgi:hypothetical protein
MTIHIKNKHNGQAKPANINLQDLLVKASQDAEIAKSAVEEVFNQALRNRKNSVNELETLPNMDEALENNGIKSPEMPPVNGSLKKLVDELDTIKRGLTRKIKNNDNRPPHALVLPPAESIPSTDRLMETVSLAREKIRRSREDAETYKKHAQAAVVACEDKEAKMREKVKAIKQQLLISTREAQAKAQKAHDEAEAIRRETWAVVKQAKMGNRKIIEDAKMEVINAREAARRAKKEAALAISRVNDTMMEVQQEIIGITVSEMSASGQEVEKVAKSPGKLVDNTSVASAQKLYKQKLTVKFDRAIQLWQSIKQTARYILRTIKTRFYSKEL